MTVSAVVTARPARRGPPFRNGVDELSDQPSAWPRSPIDEFRGMWWVAHTKARHEKALAADLDTRGISSFLPLVKVLRRYGNRTAAVHLPLFPGYLFLCGTADDRSAVLTTNRVAHLLRVADQEGLKRSLRHVHRMTTSGVAVDLYPGIQRGRRCRIRSGVLQGLEGTVLSRRRMCRVYVAVDVLGQSADVKIDPSLLEIIE